MVHLTDATGAFHAQVIAIRLDADGIRTSCAAWPAGRSRRPATRIYVDAADLEVASELLLFDRVDEVFQAIELEQVVSSASESRRNARPGRLRSRTATSSSWGQLAVRATERLTVP